MGYLRNGKPVYTQADKAKRASRTQYRYINIWDGIYPMAERKFALTEANLNETIAYTLRYNDTQRVLDGIKALESDIVQRRFEMFATMKWERTGIWTQGVSASGYWEDRQAWMYYHQCELKFAREVARRLHLA